MSKWKEMELFTRLPLLPRSPLSPSRPAGPVRPDSPLSPGTPGKLLIEFELNYFISNLNSIQSKKFLIIINTSSIFLKNHN